MSGRTISFLKKIMEQHEAIRNLSGVVGILVAAIWTYSLFVALKQEAEARTNLAVARTRLQKSQLDLRLREHQAQEVLDLAIQEIRIEPGIAPSTWLVYATVAIANRGQYNTLLTLSPATFYTVSRVHFVNGSPVEDLRDLSRASPPSAALSVRAGSEARVPMLVQVKHEGIYVLRFSAVGTSLAAGRNPGRGSALRWTVRAYARVVSDTAQGKHASDRGKGEAGEFGASGKLVATERRP